MKNLIFDWSGVVKDALTSQLWIVNKIFEEFEVVTISLEEFKENWQQPYMEFYKKYLPAGFSEDKQSELYEKFLFDKDCPEATLFPEVVQLIHKCKKNGYFLAVVSSDLSESLLAEVKEFGLESTFNEIITNADDKLGAVQKIMRDNNLNHEETYFIGDSNHEIEVSKKAGIKSVAVLWGFATKERLKSKSPDFIAHDFKELESIIL